ncbi:NAD(P)-binding protein [Corynespora cassiicola Philippines]|uniref:NAD(P)-binding protein n=1 Tax=Corynespora cassiicola Philippines TaxID=1448308 RepID=A0A2T2NF55_CORCC|nr:NAD(P)-binding protein [Corynespora cassiicola Philippines]
MTQNILITGAAGYIGGSVLADFIARTTGSIKDAKISAAVRSEEQAQALTKLGVNVILVNLESKEEVANSIVRNDIDVVVHTASSVVTDLATNLIRGLGHRRKIAGKETYFIHSSVAQAYTKEGNWPYGEIRDTDAVYEREKEINDSHHVRVTNIAVIEESKAQGVSSFIVPIPYVYGRGTGQWRRLSVNLPLYIQASIASRSVHKFEDNANPAAAHISDVTAYYSLLVEKILSNDPIPSGEEGYYFIAAHKLNWWEAMHQLAQHLHKRGLIEDPEVHIWPSYDVAADTLGLPRLYVRAMCAAGGDVIPVKANLLGWKPEWNEKRFMESLDDEIQAVLDLNTTKNTLFETLL